MIQGLQAAPAVVRATSLGNSIQVEPLTCTIGAELGNVNLGAAAGDDQLMAEIRALLLKYRVVFFRDQDITREQHVAFARRFGELEEHPVVGSHPDHPGLVQIYKTPESPPERHENSWHTDATWREKPPFGCVLRCVECPPVGGDTMWVNMRSALLSAFFAAASVGSVLGVLLGGVIADRWGWKAAFGVVGIPGLALALLYLFVRDYRTVDLTPQLTRATHTPGNALKHIIGVLARTRTLLWVCAGAAVQLIVVSAVWAWLPSYLNRVHGMKQSRTLAVDRIAFGTGECV